MELAQNELVRTQRYHRPLVLVIIDLDHFKRINDQFGHVAGDLVLRDFSQLIAQELRSIDLFGRLGGEEFALLLPETHREQAQHLAERLRQKTATHFFSVGEHEIQITMSTGVAVYQNDIHSLSEFLRWADRALYQSERKRAKSYLPLRARTGEGIQCLSSSTNGKRNGILSNGIMVKSRTEVSCYEGKGDYRTDYWRNSASSPFCGDPVWWRKPPFSLVFSLSLLH